MTRLKDLSPDHLDCRSLRHAWSNPELKIATYEDSKQKYVQRVTTCARCGTRRVESIDMTTWNVLGRHYLYVEDYLLDQPVTAVAIRKAAIMSQLSRQKGVTKK